MTAFSIQDPYANQPSKNDDDTESEFKINSSISDADAQELLKKLGCFNSNKTKRDLAAATLHLQATTWKKWSQ